MLSERTAGCADFVLFSPRKFLGVPDGGILADIRGGVLGAAEPEPPPARWWLKALEAAVLRREFDRHGGDRRWFDLFREVEAEYPVGPYAMSQLSAALLQHAFDYAAIALRRRENYRELLRDLGEIAVFRDLPAGVVPAGFPIRHPARDRIRLDLFDHRIYPPVHWALGGIVPESFSASHRLAAEIMTLPCDQRYGAEDMRRMARCVRESLAGP
jgi:hypothetical protein